MSGAYGAVGDDAGPPPRGGSGGYDRGGRGGGRGYGGGGGYQGGDRGGDRGGGYQGGDRSGDRGGGGGYQGGYQGGDRNGGRSGGGGYQGGDRGGRGGYQGGDRGHRGGGSGGGRGGGRGGREGDWVCPDSSCANVNFARRTECNKCGTPNPAGSGGNSGGGGYNNRGNDSYSSRGRGGYNDDSGERGGSYGKPQGRDGNYGQAPPAAPVLYGGQAGSYPPASNTYPSEPQSQASGYGGTGSYPPTYGAPPPTTYSGQDSGPRGGFSSRQEPRSDSSGGYASANVQPPAKVKQCDENCDETCDNARIYISNLPSDITIDELRELFGGIGLVGKIKQKRGYKDQWPWNIKIYTDDDGKNKGDACLAYEDPSAAHSAGGFFNNYELRGHKIGVTMAEKSAPKAPAFGHGGGGRGGYGGGRRYNDGGSGPDRHSHGGQRSRPY